VELQIPRGSALAHGSTYAHHPERKPRDRPEHEARGCARNDKSGWGGKEGAELW
jgi:hypothetical protein